MKQSNKTYLGYEADNEGGGILLSQKIQEGDKGLGRKGGEENNQRQFFKRSA